MKLKLKACVISTLICLSGSMLVVSADTDKTVITDPIAENSTSAEAYYITKGDTFNKVTGLISSLPATTTGLTKDYYFRMDKTLTSNYFYHVRAYAESDRTLIGDYFVAKDDSCAWRLNTGKEAALIFGSAEKMMEKTEVVIYPSRIQMGSYGIIRVHVPGMLPYDIKATSLNETIAKVSDMNIDPQDLGTTDIVVDVKIGNEVRSFTKTVSIVNKQYASDRGSDGGSSRTTTHIGIGIGWGSGGWHHHHGHHGGVDIGIGIGWDDGGYWG